MIRLILTTLLWVGSLALLQAKPNFRWSLFPSYSSPSQLAPVGGQFFALAQGSLYAYDVEDQALIPYTKLEGMSDASVLHMAYDEQTATLVLVYDNQNIDLYHEGQFYNIPDLKDKVMTQDKSVYGLHVTRGNAYLATGFGAISLDLKRKEVADTYLFRKSLQSFFKAYGYTCMVDQAGEYFVCPDHLNAYDLANWESRGTLSLQTLAQTDSDTYFLDKQGVFQYLRPDFTADAMHTGQGKGIDLKVKDGQALFLTEKGVYIQSDHATIFYPLAIDGERAIASTSSRTYWVSNAQGVNQFELQDGSMKLIQSNLLPDGPLVKDVYSMQFLHGQLYLSSGGPFRDNGPAPGLLSIYDGDAWFSITASQVKTDLGTKFEKLLGIEVSPLDPKHFFVPTFQLGVFEFYDGHAIKKHDHTNSPLRPSWSSSVWASAVAFDEDANLFVLNSVADQAFHVKDYGRPGVSDENSLSQWQSFAVPGLSRIEDLYPLLISKHSPRPLKWFLSYKNYISLNVVDDHLDRNGQLQAESKSFSKVYDQDGKVYEQTFFRSLMEDLDGDIWLGTSSGPMVISAPNSIHDLDGSVYRIKISRNDGTGLADYLLDGVTVMAMTVDAANRKWIGTSGNGLYLLSADGTEMLHHFTTANSPLPSDDVMSLAYDPETGRVFIGCIGGLAVYHGDAREGEADFEQVKVYPNPVRPEYTGEIHIQGLMNNTLVKITDINHRVVFQAKSLGGHLTWDGMNAQGERVASGVYLIYGTSEDGNSGVLTKLLIVR